MKNRRIALGIKQSEIEKISGMKTRMLQKFEQTEEITLKNLIKSYSLHIGAEGWQEKKTESGGRSFFNQYMKIKKI